MYQSGDAPRRAPAKKSSPKPKARVKRPSASSRARAQERAYASEGRAVESVANRKKRMAAQRPAIKRAKAQEQSYKSQGQSVEKQANKQKKYRDKQNAGNIHVHPGRQLKKELEGHGALAKALDYAANHIEFVSTGGGPSVKGTPLARAQKNNAKKSGASRTTLPGATISAKSAYHTAAGRLVKDALTFPAQAIPSVYVPAAGVKEAAQGHPQRLKKFAKDFSENDPVYNLGAAGVAAARGKGKRAENHLKNVAKAANEHPGLTALEFSGLKGAIGRGAGSAMRAGIAGEAGKRAASTARADRAIPNTRLVESRTYSRDVTKKAVQVAVEKSRRRKRDKFNKQAGVELKAGNIDKARGLQEQAARVDPDRLSEHEIKRRVDERVAANEDVRRANRGRIVKATKQILKPAKREGETVSVVTQRIAKANREDLAKLADELDKENPRLRPHKKRANKDLARSIRKVLDDPKADLSRIEEVANQYSDLTRPIQNKLVKYGLLDKTQAERARLIPYAVRNIKGAEYVKQTVKDDEGKSVKVQKLMVRTSEYDKMGEAKTAVTEARKAYKDARKGGDEADIEGARTDLENAKLALNDAKKAAYRDLSNGEIKAHMKANGVEPAAYVTQAPDMNSGRSFYIPDARAPKASAGRRTGESTKAGTFDASQEALVANSARMQGLVDAARGFRQIIKETGHRGENGKLARFKNYSEAQRAAKDLLHDKNGEPVPGRHEFVPVRLNALGAPKAQLEALLEDVNMEHSVNSQLISAAKGEGGNGPFALVPRAAMDRLVEHLNTQPRTAGARAYQVVNQAFRRTVLSTSPSWFAGNIIEGLGRAALNRAGPGSYLFAKRTMNRLEQINPKLAEEAMHRIVGGGHYSIATRAHVRRGAEDFQGTKMAGLASALGKFWALPGPKQAADLWGAWTDAVFHNVNGSLESKIQMAMLGRAMKNQNFMGARALKTGKAAVDEAALGLTGTKNQVMFGRMVDDMYGQYSKFSPSMRAWLTMYTPFAAWIVNATKFVYRVLPRDHPVATAVIASAEQATEQWRRDHGLDQFMGKGALPGFLQGQIPTKGGGHFRWTRYTPFGAFSDFPATYGAQVNPLMSGVLAAFKGEDWKGKKLTVKGEDGQTRDADPIELAAFAAVAFMDATIPLKSQIGRVAKEGPRALNPLRAYAPQKSKGGSSSSGSAAPAGASWNDGGGGATWNDGGGGATWTTP